MNDMYRNLNADNLTACKIIGMHLDNFLPLLNRWWVLENQNVTPHNSWYHWERSGVGYIKIRVSSDKIIRHAEVRNLLMADVLKIHTQIVAVGRSH